MATTLLPPPTPAAPAEQPPEPRARRPLRPRAVVAASLGALLLGALLNPDDVVRRAETQEFGWQRTATLRIAEANRSVSEALWLDRPRTALDRLLDGDPEPNGAPTSAPSAVVQPRRPTADKPLRIYLGGDSVAEAFGEALTRAARASEVLAPTVEFRFSTGLTRPDYFDWNAHLREVLAASPRPEVVVVLFGANDVQPIKTPSGVARAGSPAWLEEYGRRVGTTMDLLTSSGVDIYWVGQPPMRSAELSQRVSEMDDVYAAEAAKRSGVTFVDSRPLFADDRGRYAAYLPDAGGRPVLLRGADGVHLTPAGGDRLTEAVLDVISRRWPLSE